MMIKKTPNSTQGFITKRRRQMFDVTNITFILTVPVKAEIPDLNWAPISLKIIYLCSHGTCLGHLKDLDLSQVVRLWWLDGGHFWAHCISNWWPITSYFILKKEQSCYFYAYPAYKTASAPVHVWRPHTSDWLCGEWINGGQPVNVGLKKEMKMLLVMHLLSSGSRLLFGPLKRSVT